MIHSQLPWTAPDALVRLWLAKQGLRKPFNREHGSQLNGVRRTIHLSFVPIKESVRIVRHAMHLAGGTQTVPNVTSWLRIYFAVALTTLATLLLELSLTRIFSVVYFAFLAISIAWFGLGVGGVFSYVVAGWKLPLSPSSAG